jgi:hypothetical protein
MRSGVLILAVTSVNALAYNVVHTYMIKLTSAVTTTVIGEIKIVGLMVLSAVLLGAPLRLCSFVYLSSTARKYLSFLAVCLFFGPSIWLSASHSAFRSAALCARPCASGLLVKAAFWLDVLWFLIFGPGGWCALFGCRRVREVHGQDAHWLYDCPAWLHHLLAPPNESRSA